MTQKPYILISNDDGVAAKGINYLIDTLHPVADLLVVAPDSARSGYGCAITTNVPLTIQPVRSERGLKVYSCTGTPADCVKLALFQLVGNRQPDLVVSGINHGDNSSINAHYSGTMGAAFEGVLHGIPSVAFSICDHNPDADFRPMHDYIIDLVFKSITMGMPRNTCLNINFPKADHFNGVRVCRMGSTQWVNEIARARRPLTKQPVFWLTGERVDLEPEADDTDAWALSHGYVAITPTTVDNTAYELIDVLKKLM